MKKIIISIIFIIVIVGLGLLASQYLNSSKKPEVEIIPTPSVTFPTISENIEVSLTHKNNNRAVMLKVKGLGADVETVEYELTYITGSGLPRGVLGKIKSQGESELTRDEIVLGTCSSGKCVYDQGVTKVDLSLKINSAGGSSVFQKSYTL